MADLLLDLRYAWRRLTASPSFAFIDIPNLDRIVNVNGGFGGPTMSLSWRERASWRLVPAPWSAGTSSTA